MSDHAEFRPRKLRHVLINDHFQNYKPYAIPKALIRLFTDPGEVVIDPVAGSGATIHAAINCGRSAYGFEIHQPFYRAAKDALDSELLAIEEIAKYGFALTEMEKTGQSLFSL